MAIVLEANYNKRIGLPGYSSHQYTLSRGWFNSATWMILQFVPRLIAKRGFGNDAEIVLPARRT